MTPQGQMIDGEAHVISCPWGSLPCHWVSYQSLPARQSFPIAAILVYYHSLVDWRHASIDAEHSASESTAAFHVHRMLGPHAWMRRYALTLGALGADGRDRVSCATKQRVG